MCAAAFPLADDVVALGDEVGGTPEVEVGEGRAELLREGADLLASPAGCVQRVLEGDVRCGELVDDGRVEVLDPEFGEPAPDDGLVLLDRHGSARSWWWWLAAPFRSAHTEDERQRGDVRSQAGNSSRRRAWPTVSTGWLPPITRKAPSSWGCSVAGVRRDRSSTDQQRAA